MTIDLANFELLRQGAEAKLYLGNYLGQRAIIKERFPKKYRLPELDVRLTRERLRAEARSLVKCKTLGIKTPILYHVDQSCIVMEYLEGGDLFDRIGKKKNYLFQLFSQLKTRNFPTI